MYVNWFFAHRINLELSEDFILSVWYLYAYMEQGFIINLPNCIHAAKQWKYVEPWRTENSRPRDKASLSAEVGQIRPKVEL